MEARSQSGSLLCSTTSASLSCTVKTISLGSGTKTITVKAIDAAGNTGAATRTVRVR
jgi:hypothetical protein